MADKKMLEQAEVNRIVAFRLKRERDRLTKEFENRLKRCMASIHLMLHQEMCSLKWDIAAETQDTLMSDLSNEKGNEQHDEPVSEKSKRKNGVKEEVNDSD